MPFTLASLIFGPTLTSAVTLFLQPLQLLSSVGPAVASACGTRDGACRTSPMPWGTVTIPSTVNKKAADGWFGGHDT